MRIKIYTEFLGIIRLLQSRYGIAMDALQVTIPVLEKQLEGLIFLNNPVPANKWADLIVHSPYIYLKLTRLLDEFCRSWWNLGREMERDTVWESLTLSQ